MPKIFPNDSFLTRIADEIAAVGTEEIRFTGGEVSLYARFFDLVERITSQSLLVSVISNGTIFKGKLLEKSMKSTISRYLISLDSPLPEKHDRIRAVPALFATATAGMAAVKSANPLIAFEINMVVSSETIADIAAAIEFAAVHRVDTLNLIPIKEWPDLLPTRKQIDFHNESRTYLMELAKSANLQVLPPDLNLYGLTQELIERSAHGVYPRRGHCFVPTQEAFVDAVTGLVWPCNSTPYDKRKSMYCGNLHEQSFAEIWNGDRFERLRRAFSAANSLACSRTCDPSNGCNSEVYRILLPPAEKLGTHSDCKMTTRSTH